MQGESNCQKYYLFDFYYFISSGECEKLVVAVYLNVREVFVIVNYVHEDKK